MFDCHIRQSTIPAPDMDWSSEESHAAYLTWEDEADGYLRRNIVGMGPVRDAMAELGMGFWVSDYMEAPRWPHPDEYGITYWTADGEPIGERAQEYRDALAARLRWHGPDIPGIPLHKFTSNEGWHVTREECAAALALYEAAMAAGKEHPEAFRDDVIPFLRHAASADGFEVR